MRRHRAKLKDLATGKIIHVYEDWNDYDMFPEVWIPVGSNYQIKNRAQLDDLERRPFDWIRPEGCGVNTLPVKIKGAELIDNGAYVLDLYYIDSWTAFKMVHKYRRYLEALKGPPAKVNKNIDEVEKYNPGY